MNAKSRKKERKELGNCPNCEQPLHEGSYGNIPLKDEGSTESFQESLILCRTCMNKPERLFSEKVKKNLEKAEIKWDGGDIELAVLAVEAYKSARLVKAD